MECKLTDQQIKRQDFVDNTIYSLINEFKFRKYDKVSFIETNLIKVRFKGEKPRSGFMLIESMSNPIIVYFDFSVASNAPKNQDKIGTI